MDVDAYRQRFVEAMDDDFNTAQALAVLFDLSHDLNRAAEEGYNTTEAQLLLTNLATNVLGLTLEEGKIELDAAPFIELAKRHGIDISDAMVDCSRKLVEERGLADRVELTCGDAEHLPYPDNALDGIFTSFTLELFDTPAIPKVLCECRRSLRPGGRLVVNAVTLATEAILVARHAALGGELIQIAIARAEPVGAAQRMMVWRPALPVTQWRWVKP